MIIQGNDPRREASFTLRNRAGRALWNAVWLLLFRSSPRPFHRWRAAILRAFGATVGSNAHVYPGAKIWAPWNLVIGQDVIVGDDVKLYSMDKTFIGDRAVISQGTHLCCGSHDYNSPNFQLIAQPISIGADVWLCAEVFVAMGATIAEGAVVGARSVVTKSLLEPWIVYAGSPCKAIGHRKSERHLHASD